MRAFGIDVDRRRAGDLGHCGGAGCDHRRTAGHAFDHRQTEAFEPGGKEQGIGAAVERGELWTIHVIQVADAIVDRRRFEFVADRVSPPAPAADKYQIALISPLDQEAKSVQNSNHILPRFEGRNEKQVCVRYPGEWLGCRTICKARVHSLVDRSGGATIDTEAIDEITGSRIGDSDQKVGVVQGPRQVSFEAFEGRRRNRVRHRREGEVMDGRYLCLSKRFLVSMKKEVGRKNNLIAVQDPQKRLNDVAQENERWSDG